MKFIVETDNLSEIVLKNPDLMPVLTRFGIKPGFGGGTVKDVGDKAGANVPMMVEILNVFLNPEYFPTEKLLKFSVSSIVEYLRMTHNYYLTHLIPELDRLTAVFSANDKSGNMALLDRFYNNYKKALIEHINDEEVHIFPYGIALEAIAGGDLTFLPEELKGISAQQFEEEHSNVENSINDLKNIIVKYLPPDYEVNTMIDFLIRLNSFQRDIENHARIEDFILVPVIQSLESGAGKESG